MSTAKREGQILIEQHLAESRVLSESSSPLIREIAGELDRRLGDDATPTAKRAMSFKATIEQLRRASLCRTCGKSQRVFNVASRGFRAERVSAATHCTCPGGPVDLQTKGALQTLEIAPPAPPTTSERCRDCLITLGEGLGRVRAAVGRPDLCLECAQFYDSVPTDAEDPNPLAGSGRETDQ